MFVASLLHTIVLFSSSSSMQWLINALPYLVWHWKKILPSASWARPPQSGPWLVAKSIVVQVWTYTTRHDPPVEISCSMQRPSLVPSSTRPPSIFFLQIGAVQSGGSRRGLLLLLLQCLFVERNDKFENLKNVFECAKNN